MSKLYYCLMSLKIKELKFRIKQNTCTMEICLTKHHTHIISLTIMKMANNSAWTVNEYTSIMNSNELWTSTPIFSCTSLQKFEAKELLIMSWWQIAISHDIFYEFINTKSGRIRSQIMLNVPLKITTITTL